jgi:hypothetical protein
MDERRLAVARTAAVRHKGVPVLLWFAVLGGAAAWTAQLFFGWGIEEVACSPAARSPDVFGVSTAVWIGAVTLVFALLTVVAGVLAYRFWRQAGGGDPNDHVEPDGGEAESIEAVRGGRVAFMALFGVASSALFLLIIVYGGVSLLLLRPCTRT